MTFRSASARDWSAIEELLISCALPPDGAREHLMDFVVCEGSGGLVGCAGAEVYGNAALLRSVAVRDAARGSGVGGALVDAVLDRLKARKVKIVALLTTTADTYFARKGFGVVDRAILPAALRASAEFKGACPASAISMICRL